MKETVERETAFRKALVDAQIKLNIDWYQAQKEAEIISKVEKQLAPFSIEYFEQSLLGHDKHGWSHKQNWRENPSMQALGSTPSSCLLHHIHYP